MLGVMGNGVGSNVDKAIQKYCFFLGIAISGFGGEGIAALKVQSPNVDGKTPRHAFQVSPPIAGPLLPPTQGGLEAKCSSRIRGR